MTNYVITEDDPRTGDVHSLLEQHWQFTADVTPPEDIHALDLDGLLDPSVTLYALRDGNSLLGVGALKEIGPAHVEIKSMHTASYARGNGIGQAILNHLLATSAERGATRVSLETGSQDAFRPAVSMYAAAGFERCDAFGEYVEGTSSVFMTLRLS